MKHHALIILFCFFLIHLPVIIVSAQTKKASDINTYRFDFGNGKANNGFTQVSSEAYSEKTGYGIEGRGPVITNSHAGKRGLTDSFITSDQPFYFSVAISEGNYFVKVTVGDDDGTADLSIRAECRRMMVNRIQTGKGEHKTVAFTVHVRDSLIHPSNQKVRLKHREHDYLHWDNKLTLEFTGVAPKVNAIEIMSAPRDVVTVFLAGNSTVVDGAYEPYSAWGQMIPAFFDDRVVIANYAESGETLSGFIAERRFEKILSLIKPGDYTFVEFGHNDQKQKGEGIGAFTSYKKDLQYFIREVKNKGATPVVVTSVHRRRFDSAGKIEETLGEYPEAARQTAKEENVPLIDLNAMSKIMYEAWGPEESIKAFVHFPANTFPGQTKALEDNTHFRPFGAYEVAKLVVKGIRDAHLGLADLLLKDIPNIDPSKPGVLSDFYWPPSTNRVTMKPDGN